MYEYCLAHICLYEANNQIKNLIKSRVFFSLIKKTLSGCKNLSIYYY